MPEPDVACSQHDGVLTAMNSATESAFELNQLASNCWMDDEAAEWLFVLSTLSRFDDSVTQLLGHV